MAVAPMAQDNEDPDLQSSISRAILKRSSHLKSQSDFMTIASVRRLLENDLGMQPLELDAQKSLIKRLVDEVLRSGDNDASPLKRIKRRRKNARVVEDQQDEDVETGRSDDLNEDSSNVKMVPEEMFLAHEMTTNEKTSLGETCQNKADRSEETAKLDENPPGTLDVTDSQEPDSKVEHQAGPAKIETNGSKSQEDDPDRLKPADEERTVKVGNANDIDIQEGAAEVVAEKDTVLPRETENENSLAQSKVDARNVSESEVHLALVKRAGELKIQTETLTMSKVRLILEEDLGLPPNGLNGHKQFIRKLVDELLREESIDPSDIEKTSKNSHGQGVKKVRSLAKIESTSRGGKIKLQSEEDVKSEEKLQENVEVLGIESEEEKQIKKRQKKAIKEKEKTPEREKTTVIEKKVTEVKRPFSARVERLREILKAAGIGVSPAIYRKAKLAHEDERDDVLIKELESRLMQEGLSSNPTEKEIKKTKARLEKKKDLDGIESSNIVAEPRRSRASANSWFTPRPSPARKVEGKTPEAKDSDDDGDGDGDGDATPHVTGAMDD